MVKIVNFLSNKFVEENSLAAQGEWTMQEGPRLGGGGSNWRCWGGLRSVSSHCLKGRVHRICWSVFG